MTVLERHHRLLREVGAAEAARLRSMAPGQTVLVAGVRPATQTPPTSGERVLFVTLADSSGLVDVTFVEGPHETCAQTVFHSELLLVRGALEERGQHPSRPAVPRPEHHNDPEVNSHTNRLHETSPLPQPHHRTLHGIGHSRKAQSASPETAPQPRPTAEPPPKTRRSRQIDSLGRDLVNRS